MEKSDSFIFQVLLDYHERYRFPRMQSLHHKVQNGELLDDMDIDFMKSIHTDISKILPMIERHPEYHTLFSRVVSMYREISVSALDNEQTKKN